jgi:hypothetical protein
LKLAPLCLSAMDKMEWVLVLRERWDYRMLRVDAFIHRCHSTQDEEV